MEFIKDMCLFILERRNFWLAPVIIALLLLGILIVLSAGSPSAPFVYAVF